MFKRIWLNFAFDIISKLIAEKMPQIDIRYKEAITFAKDNFQKLIDILTDENPNDAQQALDLLKENKQKIAILGIDFCGEIITEKVKDETAKMIAKQAVETLKQALTATK